MTFVFFVFVCIFFVFFVFFVLFPMLWTVASIYDFEDSHFRDGLTWLSGIACRWLAWWARSVGFPGPLGQLGQPAASYATRPGQAVAEVTVLETIDRGDCPKHRK